jgi:hypothetical protein
LGYNDEYWNFLEEVYQDGGLLGEGGSWEIERELREIGLLRCKNVNKN